MNILDFGYFKLARNVSKYSDHKTKVGCVICKKRPIAVGANHIKTHPRCNDGFSKSTHAEVKAIINSGQEDLSGATVYVYREHKNGSPALAKPCNNCLNLLKQFGIKKIYYSQDIGIGVIKL